MKRALIIFVRIPEAGKVKTRLAATVGNEAALNIYQKLLLHTLAITQAVEAEKFVFYAGAIAKDDIWHQNHYHKHVQENADLGTRMSSAFQYVFEQGYQQVIIIGSDCPTLTTEHINHAFEQLNNHEIVIGPASDGGYYLLGLQSLHKELFEDKAWSTDTVYSDTVRTINLLQLTHHALETLTDVDEEKDLPESWRAELEIST
jgi:rSAM/selenodomain-associated transferase 1